MGSLEVMEVLLVDTNSLLKLLDVLRPSLAEGGLGLPVALLPLFRGRIDLKGQD